MSQGNYGPSTIEPLAISPARAAAALGIGRTKIYELIADGSLKSFKIGTRRLVTVESLRNYMAMRTGS